MKIVVCIKEVPDTEAYLKIGADQKSINETQVTFILNPYDEYAVEEAIRISEQSGAETTALCLGAQRAEEVLRTALAMGIQKASRIALERPMIDPLAEAETLAEGIKALGFDLVLLGKEAIDSGSQAVGPMLAEILDVPCISNVIRLTLSANALVAEREIDGGIVVYEADLPCVITTQKGLNEPRYPSLRGKMMAKKAEIPLLSVTPRQERLETIALSYPPTRGKARRVGEGVEAVQELVRLLREEAKVI